MAVKKGLQVAIISGGNTSSVKKWYENLGVQHIYLGVSIKVEALFDFMNKTGISTNEIMYMGDDIPDLDVMEIVGLPVCPADAVPEIKCVAQYISRKEGGRGCARDVIEQVMKEQDLWLDNEAFGW